jgi:hypothetical protein
MSTRTSDAVTHVQPLYRRPTLAELIDLCIDFGLVSDLDRDGELIRMTCREETFDVSAREAELLVRGLLIGYFAMHTQDDLGLAAWEN